MLGLLVRAACSDSLNHSVTRALSDLSTSEKELDKPLDAIFISLGLFYRECSPSWKTFFLHWNYSRWAFLAVTAYFSHEVKCLANDIKTVCFFCCSTFFFFLLYIYFKDTLSSLFVTAIISVKGQSSSAACRQSDKRARARTWTSFQPFLSILVTSWCLCGSFSSFCQWLVSFLSACIKHKDLGKISEVCL